MTVELSSPSDPPRRVSEADVVRWGKTELAPQAGVAVYVRGPHGKLAAARIYDDIDPPLGPTPPM